MSPLAIAILAMIVLPLVAIYIIVKKACKTDSNEDSDENQCRPR